MSAADPRRQKLSEQKIAQLLDCWKTPRIRSVENLQAFVEGKAYEGRPSFFDDSCPINRRAPSVVWRLAGIAAESNEAFALGEGRFPSILALSSESDDAFDQQLGLSKNDSALLDSFNSKIVDLACLQTNISCAYKMAQAARSVALIWCYRDGRPALELVWAKLATPYFQDDDPCKPVVKLEVRYRYTDVWRDPILTGGEWWTCVYEYLRVIDDKTDTVYQPKAIWEVTDSPIDPAKSPIKSQTLHGFARCPVLWYARKRMSVVGVGYDGEAVHDGLCGMLERLDISLSQRDRAALYAGDPQTVLSGVSDEDPIGQQGVRAMPVKLPGDQPGTTGAQWQRSFVQPATDGQGNALRRGVGQVWRITDPQGKALLLCLPADALDALDKNGKDLAQKLCDDMGITIVDPSVFKGGGDLSGRTLSFIFSKQINRVSKDRIDLEKNLILPALNLLYRLLLDNSQGVYLPGLEKVLPILARFYKKFGDGAQFWFPPQLKCKWGPYFDPSDTDEATQVTMAVSARDGGLITTKTAIEHVKAVFSISSVDQYILEVQKEAADKQQQALDLAQKQAAIATPAAPGGPPGKPAPAGPTAKPDAKSAPTKGTNKAKK